MKSDKARAADRAYRLNLAHRRFAAGLCLACGNLNADGRYLCKQCHERQAGYEARYSGRVKGILSQQRFAASERQLVNASRWAAGGTYNPGAV